MQAAPQGHGLVVMVGGGGEQAYSSGMLRVCGRGATNLLSSGVPYLQLYSFFANLCMGVSTGMMAFAAVGM